MYKRLAVMVLMLICIYESNPTWAHSQIDLKPSKRTSCPSKNFKVFLKKFSNDINVQMDFTQYPLKYVSQYIDITVEGSIKTDVEYLTRDQIDFPVLQLPRDRKEANLKIFIENLSNSAAYVITNVPETDITVHYYFKKNGCWQLERVENGPEYHIRLKK